MKTLILAALVGTVLASAVSVNAAPRQQMGFDGHKFFEDIAKRSGQ